MASIRTRKDNGCLFLDFYYRGTRCREQTALPSTPANRKRLEKVLSKIQEEISFGSFDYAGYFPNSRNVTRFASELETVDAKLAANQKAHELQTKRIRLIKERDELGGRRDEIARRLGKLISEDGYTLFTSGLIKRGQEIVGRLRSEGKIPARVLNTFLQELIDNGR